MRNSIINLVFLLFLYPFASNGQKYSDDIRKALTVYNQSRLELDAQVEIYANYNAVKPSQSYTAHVKKEGAKFFSESGDMKMLLNDKYLVMVYKSEKRIVYSKHDKDAEKKMNSARDPGTSIDSLLLRNDSIVYKGVKDNRKLYIIYNSKSMIRRTEIYMDTKTGWINRLIYYYDEQLLPNANKVRIDYTINTDPVFSGNEFSESRFFVISRGKASPASTFAGYDILFIDGETINTEEQ